MTAKTRAAKSATRNELTPKEQRFVAEYLVDRNQTAAATRAGYAAKGAKYTGYELMKRAPIRAAIDAALAEQQQRTLITADQVLLDIQDMGNEARVAGKLDTALRSRELLGKHFRLFAERVEAEVLVKKSPAELTDDELAAIATGKGAVCT